MKKIIYVFGPRRLAETYFANRPMMLNEGGWLKIGQTTNSDEKTGVKDSALNRIRQETRTGIPEVCQIFDVFEYPDRTGNTDNTIREILTEDVYKLECSKKHNSEIEKYEIKAGTEFVYGVTRKQVLNSIAKFEHGLILEHYGRDDFAELMQCIKNNAKNAEQYEIESDESSHDNYESTQWADMLWDSVKKELEVQIKSKICTNKGRPYISIASNKHKGTITYTAVYSVRYGLASVAIETFGGESAKETIDKKIQSSTEKHSLKTITAKQGIKNKNKWSWAISVPIDKSDDELIKWYVDTILSFYRFFEN